MLAREADARAAGSPIYALIRGWGYSSDGSGGITAPKVEGQRRALQQTYARAGYSLATVGLIEGHGTGTAVGDKVEIMALRQVLEASPGEEICRLGSIKGNIGHCKAAAGAAGIIKAVMALHRKILPPTVNCERPNPAFGQPLGRLRPNIHGDVWRPAPTPRRASVSAMGFGGANAHVTLEEANPDAVPSPQDLALLGSHQESELILLSAESHQDLARRVEHLRPIADRICWAELTDMAAALATAPHPGALRLAIVAESPWQLAAALTQVSQRLAAGVEIATLDDAAHGIYAGTTREAPTCVALCPGQGSQRLNMGAHLWRRYPFVRDLYAHADAAVAALLPGGLSPYIFRDLGVADAATQRTWETELRATHVAQPALVLASLATLRVLTWLGVQPSIAIGHSLGEISALCVAGACDEDTAVRLAAVRGQAMAALHLDDPGAMVAIAAGPAEVEQLIAPFGAALVISNYNAPRQTVVSGTSEAISALRQHCKRRQVPCSPLPVSHAFHSDLVAPAAVAFREAVADVEFSALSGTVVSTATGRALTADLDLRTVLGDHIRQPVRFVEAVVQAADQRPALWIEVGPGAVLTGLVRDILGAPGVECLPTDVAGKDGLQLVNNILARAYVLGFPVAVERLFAFRFSRPFPLEHYAPQFIVNPCERPVVPLAVALDAATHTLQATFLPPEASQADFGAYLRHRGPFLRDFIALDYRHYAGDGAPQMPLAALAPMPQGPQEAGWSGEVRRTDQEGLLTFATQWIAQRTGYPEASIAPEMRLRDDLNLDSIKVGDLVLVLSRQLGRPAPTDPAAFANAPLGALLETLAVSHQAQHVPTPLPVAEGLLAHAGSLAPWVRTFCMERIAAPLEAETPLAWPVVGPVYLIAEAVCPQTQAIANRLRREGLHLVVTDTTSLFQSGDAPAGLAGCIIVVPEVEPGFLQTTPEAFDDRVEGMAARLFRIFTWVRHGREDTWADLRCVVLRPVTGVADPGSDRDAGTALLRTLRLEYPGVHTKWVCVPATWAPERWADVTADELRTSSARVVLRYDEDGRRTTEVALPVRPATGPVPVLGTEDVVLVTGGAKGITSELAFALAHQTRVKLALLGSSPLPAAAADPQEHEILRSLRRLDQAGVSYRYVQCDVTDLEAVRRAVRTVEQDLGPVTAVLHGAGISHLQLFRDLDLDRALQCIRVKTRGLYNVLTVVPPSRLKALHVLSSVLGKTGMRGQADYTFANAWLDGAVQHMGASHPHLHCLSLGYSVWSETGLGVKLDALATLTALGVVPVSTADGVAAYLDLVQHPPSSATVVITGRLTPELETTLFAVPAAPRGRFLERVLRWIPGTELVTDATLSHHTDLYLPEHIFDGTPILPGVMALEAMVEAAMACTGRTDLPVLQHVHFHRPLIVHAEASVVIRLLALSEALDVHTTRVRVVLRSDSDGFAQDYCEAICTFGLELLERADLPCCPPLAAPLAQDPETFSPVPLFQGKFFRRITALHTLEMEQESLTEVTVPAGEHYYSTDREPVPVMPAPAARDAFLQSVALILPPGGLPTSIEEVGVYRRTIPQERLLCHSRIVQRAKTEWVAEIAIFTTAGELVETLRGVVLRLAPATGAHPFTRQAARPIPHSRVMSDLQALRPDLPHAVVLIDHEELKELEHLQEISPADLERVRRDISGPRQTSALANLVATRRAALLFARQHRQLELSPRQVSLTARANGKPEMRFDDSVLGRAFDGIDVSLADGAGVSVALVGPAPVGVDCETVEARDAETWRGLLGDDGYALALRVAAEAAEPFDRAATRVWTVLEAGKKANALHRVLPHYEAPLGGPWLALAGTVEHRTLDFLCAILAPVREAGALMALTVTLAPPQLPTHQRL